MSRPSEEDVDDLWRGSRLLLVWPTPDAWAGEALASFRGTRVAYVGEGPGGRMGDDVFHASLGMLDSCVACSYGVVDSPCVCAVPRRWRHARTIKLPHWGGYDDDLHLFERIDA